MINKSKKQPYC